MFSASLRLPGAGGVGEMNKQTAFKKRKTDRKSSLENLSGNDYLIP